MSGGSPMASQGDARTGASLFEFAMTSAEAPKSNSRSTSSPNLAETFLFNEGESDTSSLGANDSQGGCGSEKNGVPVAPEFVAVEEQQPGVASIDPCDDLEFHSLEIDFLGEVNNNATGPENTASATFQAPQEAATEEVLMNDAFQTAALPEASSKATSVGNSHYRQMTEAAQARAADVRQRLQAYLKSKTWEPGQVPTSTKPKTPQVLKRSQSSNTYAKTTEERQLEEILKHRNDLKALFLQQRKTAAQKLPQKQKKVKHKPPTVAKSPAMFHRTSKAPRANIESSEDREAREMREAQQTAAAQMKSNRRYRESIAYRVSIAENHNVHSTRQLTIPKTPKCMYRASRSTNVEGQNIFNEDASRHISISDCDSFYKNLRAESSKVLAQAKLDAQKRPKITVPEPPNFASDARAAAYSATHPPPLTKEEQELKIMAEHQFRARKFNRDVVLNGAGSSGVAKVKSRPSTIVEPFKITSEYGNDPAPTTAGPASSSQKQETGSFKARPMPITRQSTGGMPITIQRRPSTVPHAPRLSISNRRQSTSSVADADSTEIKEFRARPMPDYTASNFSSVAAVKTRELTVPTSPRISKSNRRSQAQPSTAADEENDANVSNFQARPMPNYNALNQLGKHSEVRQRSLTVPKSPLLSVSNRNVPKPLSSEEAQVAELQHQFKARPAPSERLGGGHAGIGMVHRRPITEPEPFDFPGETYHEQAQGRIEERRRQKEEEETKPRQFLATPMPKNENPAFIPKHSEKGLTEFEEFDMTASEIFHAKKCEWAERRAAQEAVDEEQQRDFRARPLPTSTYEATMVPKPSEREPVVPDNVEAYNPPRAAERRAYDEANKQRIEKENALRDALVEQREQEAEDEYRQLMRTPIAKGGLRFTARDLPNTTCGSPDFVPVPSDAPLTDPYTPMVLKRPVGRSSMRRTRLGGGALRVSTVN